MDESHELHWYAAYVRVNQELIIKSRLDELGIENFLPMNEQVRVSRTMSFSLINDYALNICYIKDRENRHSLIIPDKQMEDFMFLLDFSPESIELVNKNLKHGDRVRVIKGPLTGLEGELLRIKGHKRVIVRLEGVVSIATSYIPGSFLEKIV